jgi:hypothetical protein
VSHPLARSNVIVYDGLGIFVGYRRQSAHYFVQEKFSTGKRLSDFAKNAELSRSAGSARLSLFRH